jgi:ABC-2 type transport system permease protein
MKHMRVIWVLMKKEFAQILRDKFILPFVLIIPLLQILLLPYATTFEISDIRVAYIDKDHSQSSHLLAESIEASPYFILVSRYNNEHEAFMALDQNEADVIVQVPLAYEKNMINENEQSLMVSINALNIGKAEVIQSYLTTLLDVHYVPVLMEELSHLTIRQDIQKPNLQLHVANWFNATLNFDFFMVPGLLVILLITSGMFLATMNIVKEKESGTIEQINVSPITKFQFVGGKLFPFMFISFFQLTFMLLIARYHFGVPFRGEVWIIYLFALLYILASCGIGLLISTISQTQYQGILIGYFFLTLFMLLGGFFSSIENMPALAQLFTYLNPIRYFIEVIRAVMLKGSELADLKMQFGIMTMYAVVVNLFAVLAYRKRAA